MGGHIPEPWRRGQAALYGFVEPVPVSWASRWRNPEPGGRTDGGRNGEMISLDAFRDVLEREGMREPVMIRICAATGRGRLEAGNHRCRIAEGAGQDRLPCIVSMGAGPVMNEDNGRHVFDMSGELRADAPLSADADVLIRPGAVFDLPLS